MRSPRGLCAGRLTTIPNRGQIEIPDIASDVVPGFSHEYINYMLGGSFRSSFRPLNDAIMSGRIRGVVANVGCNNPRTTQDASHDYLVREFLKNDVLVVETGCGALASGKVRSDAGRGRPGVRRTRAARGLRGHRDATRAAPGLVRRQLPHPDGAHTDGRRRRAWATTQAISRPSAWRRNG